jgi:hypothetical protein
VEPFARERGAAERPFGRSRRIGRKCPSRFEVPLFQLTMKCELVDEVGVEPPTADCERQAPQKFENHAFN